LSNPSFSQHFTFPEPENREPETRLITHTNDDPEIQITTSTLDNSTEEVSLEDESDSSLSESGLGDGTGTTWPSRKRFLRKSVLSDWGINFDELTIEKKIGEGRSGQVFLGKWHGDVAIKKFNVHNPTKEQMAQFRKEVQLLRKVRHENVVLFMGFCMDLPNLCIVTEYLKGKSLHSHIHEHGKAFTERQSINIIEQVSQALGYLHHRGIIHKNLKSKNIHLSDKKAVICDFGLGSMTDLKLKSCEKGYEVLFNLNVYYLAPEIIRKLQAVVAGRDLEEVEFTEYTDVYALGTVWYEILAGHWPWPGLSPEQVWWHVGKGIVPDVSSSTPELSTLLLQCWSSDFINRPNAAYLAKEISSLPLPRILHRSPSHPVGLKSRS